MSNITRIMIIIDRTSEKDSRDYVGSLHVDIDDQVVRYDAIGKSAAVLYAMLHTTLSRLLEQQWDAK